MISIVMGKPGAGKSTWLAYTAYKYMKKGIPVWSNVQITGAYKIDLKNDLNTYQIENGLLVIDEAGFEFNARNFKSFSDKLYRFFTMHRHYNIDVILAVQFWDRLDIVLRELVQRIIVVKPTIFKRWFVCSRDINCAIDINEEGQIIERFSWELFITGLKYYPVRKARRLFNSYYKDNLKEKSWDVWQ